MLTTFIVLALYSLLIIGIAVYAYSHTRNYEDYLLGSRRFSGVITAMGVAATDMSAWLMLSVPAVFYLYGANQIWLPLGLLIGSFINWHMVAPRLRVYTEVAKNSLTLPSFFQNRFVASPRSALRVVSALIFLIFFTCYAASGFVGTAKLFTTAFDLDYAMALYVSVPVIIFYTAIGGYLAVNWIDLFQGFLMLFALVFVALIAGIYLNDTPALTASLLPISEYAQRLNIWDNLTVISLLSALAWGLGYFGQPHILVRFMSSRGRAEIRIGKYICLIWMALALGAAAMIGIMGFYYFPLGTLSSPEVVFPELAQQLLSNWFSAIVFAAIISAIISTVAAVLFAAASSLVEDLYAPFLRPHAKSSELVWVGRLMILCTASVAILLALHGENPSVFKLVSHAWAGLGAAFGPVVLMSLFWSRMSYWGAFLGIAFGGLMTLIWIFCSYTYSAPIFSLYEIIPGFCAGFLGILIGSYLRPVQSGKIALQHQLYLKKLISPERGRE